MFLSRARILLLLFVITFPGLLICFRIFVLQRYNCGLMLNPNEYLQISEILTDLHKLSFKSRREEQIAEGLISKLSATLNVFDEDDDDDDREAVSCFEDEFKGPLYGYPLYEKGFAKSKCGENIDESSRITFVFDLTDLEANFARNAVRKTRKEYPKVKIVALVDKTLLPDIAAGFVGIRFFAFDDVDNSRNFGYKWNNLAARCETRYVLLAINVHSLDKDLNLRRLTKVLLSVNPRRNAIIGGSIKNPFDGKWSLNCYQTTASLYRMEINPGYRESSTFDCVYCDYFVGPILMKREDFIPFDESFKVKDSALLDFFHRHEKRGGDALVCPDSMNEDFLEEFELENEEKWKEFGKKWEIFSANGVNIRKLGDERCRMRRGMANSPPCDWQIVNLLGRVFDACERVKARCELQEGTLLGAVKMGRVLPWDRDADLAVKSRDMEALVNELWKMKPRIAVTLEQRTSCWEAVNRSDDCSGGRALIKTASWTVELNGQTSFTHDEEDAAVWTKVRLGSKWFPASRNPGNHARNRYGPGLFKHAQHWTETGLADGWQVYPTDAGFSGCPVNGHHACLNNFHNDGNRDFLLK